MLPHYLVVLDLALNGDGEVSADSANIVEVQRSSFVFHDLSLGVRG